MGNAIARPTHEIKIDTPAISMKGVGLISTKSYVLAQQANANPNIDGNSK